MRRILFSLMVIVLAVVPVIGDTLPDGAVARVGSTRFREDGGTGSVAFSPDGKWIVTKSAHFAAVWEVETGKQVFRTSKEANASVGFAHDGKIVRVVESEKI